LALPHLVGTLMTVDLPTSLWKLALALRGLKLCRQRAWHRSQPCSGECGHDFMRTAVTLRDARTIPLWS